MAIDPRIALLQDFGAPAHIGATVASAFNPLPALNVGLTLEDLAQRRAAGEREAQMQGARMQLEREKLGAERDKTSIERQKAIREAAASYLGALPDNATRDDFMRTLDQMRQDPILEPLTTMLATQASQLPDEDFPKLVTGLRNMTPEWQKARAQAAFPKQTGAESTIGKIRADLAAGRITPADAEQAIRNLEQRGPSTVISLGSGQILTDANGNPVMVQPANRPGVAPQVTPLPGLTQRSVSEIKSEKKEADAAAAEQATMKSVRNRAEQLATLLQQNPSVAGPAGYLRRLVETGVGAIPGQGNIPTPAIDYNNNLFLMLADVRKIVEKDPNLSNQERQNLMAGLGGGILNTPGSALRAINNVVQYMEGRSIRTGSSRQTAIEDAVKASGIAYEPEKYDYRVVNGQVQRRAKGP